MNLTKIAASGVLLTLVISATSFAQRPLSVRQIAAATRPAVVTIQVPHGDEFRPYGIGFVIRSDGVIVTSLRVAAGVDDVRIELDSGEIYDNVHVLGHDKRRDLLLLQIPAIDLAWLDIADDRAAYVGDAVYAVGNPTGSELTFSDGILSSKQLEGGVVQLQTTAGISARSAGGPILDVAGQAVGVAITSSNGDDGMTVAVSARYAQGLLSFAGDRVPFDQFAAELNRTTYGLLATRERELRQLMESLPANVRAEMDSLEPAERQVAVRTAAAAAPLAASGWTQSEYGGSDSIEPGTVNTLSVRLDKGRYHAISRCEDNCGELDLTVWNSDDEKIAEDVTAGASANVEFEVRRRADYRFDTRMVKCVSDSCRYGIQLFVNE